MASGVLSVNWIPRYNRGNWPGDTPGYFCGTIPTANAACLEYSSTNIASPYPPRTFEKCCNGPIINITSPVTDPKDPSYGTSCLAYCAVDLSRSSGLRSGFSDYFTCLQARTNGSYRFDDSIYGSVTCGWGNNSRHEKCVSSVSIQKDLATKTTVALSDITNAVSSHMTFSTCPPETTASTTTTPAETPTAAGAGKTSGARSENREMSVGSMFVVALMVSSSFLFL
ncbi:uncharacterized protein BP5553_01596 [Venustampulla echinocandica]|uniref:Uncharacterized protein n=1 Tax=Venustampulla echinocandica TaxID=2656787 RepID=A0A370U1G9_9HELO|nr:uncharacterized protein BP5553_01596 [Venustampulla echinocandica]RDL41617.1 hypothetical protein BP5553_01596 [Venustampulla echinocandica]